MQNHACKVVTPQFINKIVESFKTSTKSHIILLEPNSFFCLQHPQLSSRERQSKQLATSKELL